MTRIITEENYREYRSMVLVETFHDWTDYSAGINIDTSNLDLFVQLLRDNVDDTYIIRIEETYPDTISIAKYRHETLAEVQHRFEKLAEWEKIHLRKKD